MLVMTLPRDLQRHAAVVVLATCGGYFGATIQEWTKAAPATIKARRFEVVGQAGNVLGYLGPASDTRVSDTTQRGLLLVFLDPSGVRRCQIGVSDGSYSPRLLFYGKDGPPDKPKPYDYSQPRLGIGLGWTDSPTLNMRGQAGDKVALGAIYGDVSGTPELGWGLSFRALKVSATADIGYARWLDGTYRSSITLNDGAGNRWEAIAGEKPKPLPLRKRSN
jgi:hypothetical protein